MAWVDSWAQPAPLLIWGLLSRGTALAFLISFASLTGQVLPIAGRRGVTPIAGALAAIERDFPSWKRLLYFPSLLWLHRGDGMLRALPWLGMLGAALSFVGGPLTPLGFGVCYLVYLSLDRPMSLVYPWDCALFEAGLLALLLPPTALLPNLEITSAPHPILAWTYRLLVFRVMLGFGKHKFAGSTRRDATFLKSFFVQQPLPTPLGWYAQKLPLFVLVPALWLTFVIEIIVPFGVFFPGAPATLAALLTIMLMAVIQLTGNFGYFNLLMIVLGLSWLDHQTARELSLDLEPSLMHALLLVHGTLALLAFPYNTFCAHTWMNWSPWTRIKTPVLRAPAAFARMLHPFRIAHAYGVFPPQTPPAVRFAPTIEVSWDEGEWHTLTHRYSPVLESSPPKWCAPHHERFDQAVVYESIGLNEASIFRNVVGRWDPYGYGGVPGALMFLHQIVSGTLASHRFFDGTLLSDRGPPEQARVRLYMLEPTSIAEHKRTGHYWKRRLVGPHFPPIGRDDGDFDEPLPVPEQWHFDDVIWLKRSKLGALMRRAQLGQDPHRLALQDSDGLGAEDAERLWNELLPTVVPGCRESWQGLRARVLELRERYGRTELQRLERLMGRYAALLFARLEPLFLDQGIRPLFDKAKPSLDVKTNYHLRLLAYHVLSDGRAAYDAVFADPTLASEHARRMTLHSGNYLLALFRYEAFVYQSQKLRLLAAYVERVDAPEKSAKDQARRAQADAFGRRAFGALDMVDFLKTQFLNEEDVLDVPEHWPRFRLDEHGQVHRVG